MPTPSIQTLTNDAQQVLNLESISAVRSVVAATLANANAGTPLNPNLTTQQLWNEFYQIVTQPKSDIESIIANQLMKFMYAPPAPGGAGADKQVIFNDGGVLAGDAGLTYNKTTDALTITGDLTVDTSTLKVDSANNRVGIGTASPSGIFHAANLGTAGTTADNFNGYFSSANRNSNVYILAKNTEGSNLYFGDGESNTVGAVIYDHTSNYMRFDVNGIEQYRIAPLGVNTWSDGAGGTRMTLNSTGLGVGDSPTQPLTVRSSAAAIGMFHSTNVNGPYVIFQNSTGNFGDIGSELSITGGGSAGNLTLNSRSTSNLCFAVADSVKIRIDSSGNVGIGVTPSAWDTGFQVIENSGGSLWSGSTGAVRLSQNVYYATSLKYKNALAASQYVQTSGQHQWYNAPSGTANDPIAFGDAKMTLAATGNLLVGTTTDIAAVRMQVWSTDSNNTAYFRNSNATTPYGPSVKYTAATPNNTGSEFLYCEDSTAVRVALRSNGGIANYQANNVSLSDSRMKSDIKPLGSYWNKIKSLEVVTFKYNDQTHSDDNIGLIAQQVESVAPELVDVDGFGETPVDGVPLKTIYTTDLYHAAIKALQEAMSRIEALEAKLA